MKKYLVLGILFLLPITVYIFFASGVNNFAKLPVLTENVSELTNFKSFDSASIQLEGKITVLGFFGNAVEEKKGNAFNLAHKIYKKNHQFEDFQFVILVTEDQRTSVTSLKNKISEIADPSKYHFAYAEPEVIAQVFLSLQNKQELDTHHASDWVYIIDKDRNLRGRKADEDEGVKYGFNAADYAEINNKMGDDVKVILAEYRLALKKYKAKREI